MREKNHGGPQTAEYTMGEEYNNQDTQRQRPLVLFFATRGGYSWDNDLSHSLSLSHSFYIYTHALYNFFSESATTTNLIQKFFALSHIYTYMTSGLFTYLGRMDRNRVFGHPVLPNFHPEGPVSQHLGGHDSLLQNSPFIKNFA